MSTRKTQSKTVNVFHHLSGAAKIVIAAVFGALVLVFFWHPFWHLWIEIGQKADSIFPGK